MEQQSIVKNAADEPLILLSLGRHTRLGDALEYALEGVPFTALEPDDIPREGLKNKRLLLAASADRDGENAQMRLLAARLRSGAIDLGGCVCAAIADGEQGGAIHLDALRLLLSANEAGAQILPRPMLEAGRDLRTLTVGGKGTPFQQYCALARALVSRLNESKTEAPERRRIRLDVALDSGAASDWLGALKRTFFASGIELTSDADAEETLLLCENTAGLPDERTRALLDGGGRIRFLIASPANGSDLFTTALFERACVRGNYALPPKAVVVFDGMSAVEALASKREMEKLSRVCIQ